MPRSSRLDIFASAARKLRSDFEALSTVPHNLLKGLEAEKIIRRFLNEHIPKRFAAGSGFITDSVGNISRQVDVVIYDAFNCPVYRASDEAAIFPSNNVATVVEVKSQLNKDEIYDAWNKIASVKSLAKTKALDTPLPTQHLTSGVLFAFDTKLSLNAISNHYHKLFGSKGIGHHIDYIVILDKGIITLSAKPRGAANWNFVYLEGLGGPSSEGSHLAISISEFEEYTLDAFFRLLLPHLIFFRNIVDHPGFDWDSFPIKQKCNKLQYLTSITHEQDPARRNEKLLRYAKEVEEEFKKNPIPKDK